MKNLFKFTITLFFVGLSLVMSLAQNSSIYGKIKDGESDAGNPLGFANVGIPALNLGATTDLDGNYRILNVPIGKHTLQISYVGYETHEVEISVYADKATEFNHTLLPSEGSNLGEVVIAAQAIGQKAAINQQINSNTIVNVISKEKLRELPDQNAAEAVGRISGVAVQRDGGEGQKIVLRGLSPRFNSITINGERIPSTDGEDRSVDLSMISPDMLAGIEVFKAIKPDMEGDAIGGTVNFIARKASDEPNGNVTIMSTYNGQQGRYGLFRGNASYSRRFLDKKLGFLITANGQRADRSSDLLEASYRIDGSNSDGSLFVRTDNVILGDRLETRDRFGGSLALDYSFNKDNSVFFTTNFGQTDRDELRYRRVYRVNSNEQQFEIRERFNRQRLLSNVLSGDHKFGALNFTWRGSYSTTAQTTPNDLDMRFREPSASIPGKVVPPSAEPDVYPSLFKNDLNLLRLYDTRSNADRIKDNMASFQADLKYDFRVNGWLSGFFKTGGKIRAQNRYRNLTGYLLEPYLSGVSNNFRNKGIVFNQNGISMANFIGNYQADPFLNGRFDIMPGSVDLRKTAQVGFDGVDVAQFNKLFGTNYAATDKLNYNGQLDMARVRNFFNTFQSNYNRNPLVETEDYEGDETVSASYLMTELNISKPLLLVGGVRYERTEQIYRGKTRLGTTDDELVINPGDTGAGPVNEADFQNSTPEQFQTYGELLPMVQMRYKPISWFDLRLAATKTLNRPNFRRLVPWERIDVNNRRIDRGNAGLSNMTAWNFDAYASLYNRFGLFTVGAYYKDIKNVDYQGTLTIFNNIRRGYTERELNYLLVTPLNAPVSIVKGLEVDLQANLSTLTNKYLKGITFNANVTFVNAESDYTFTSVREVFTPPFTRENIATDTTRKGRFPGQAAFIFNTSIGYDLKGFSGRLSLSMQNDALNEVGLASDIDGFTGRSVRLDLALKQRINKRLTAIFNLNNMTNQPEISFDGSGRTQENEAFGLTADLGLQFKF